jgi:hypothetical protein
VFFLRLKVTLPDGMIRCWVLFDEFVRGIYEGDLMQDVTFKLLEKNGNGEIIEVVYKGPWLISDNGYLSLFYARAYP